MNECIWIHYCRPRPHWYGLDEATRRDKRVAWAALAARSQESGGNLVGRYHVRGHHDFETVEIWRFPTAEAAFQHWSDLTAAGYGEFNAFANNIGLAAEAPQP
jgi:hypothetical protein